MAHGFPAFGRIYRLDKALDQFGLWRDWFDAWIRDDRMLCVHCGAQHERHANAACCAWRWVHEGLEGRVQTHRIQAAGQVE